MVVGLGGASDGRGGEGRELALVENNDNNNGDIDEEEEGDYGNGFVDLNGNGDRDPEGVGVEEDDEEDDDDDEDYGKRKRRDKGKSKRARHQHQQFSASSPPPPRPGEEKAVAGNNNDANDANDDDDDDENDPAASKRRRFRNGLGTGNGVYFDGGDGSRVRFRVSVTMAIPEDAAAKLGLPLDDRDRRLIESKSSASKSMPLVFIERAAFQESAFVYGTRAADAPEGSLLPSASALAKARASPSAEKRAQQLRQLFFPLNSPSSQSSEFVFRGRHRAWVMRFFVYPPNNKRQITSGLSPLIRDCFGSAAASASAGRGGGGGGAEKAGGGKKKRNAADEAKRLSNLWELVAWRGQDRGSGGGGGGGGGGGKGKGKGRRGGGGDGDDYGDDGDDDDGRDDEPASVVLPSGQRVPAIWFEFAKVKQK